MECLSFIRGLGIDFGHWDALGRTVLHCLYDQLISPQTAWEILQLIETPSRHLSLRDVSGQSPCEIFKQTFQRQASTNPTWSSPELQLQIFRIFEDIVDDGVLRLGGEGIDSKGTNNLDELRATLQSQYKEVIDNAKNGIAVEAMDGSNAFHAQAGLMTAHDAATDLYSLEKFISVGIDANDYDGNGRTPLEAIITQPKDYENELTKSEKVSLLIDKGRACVHSHNRLGHTPLYSAAIRGLDRTVEALLLRGSHVNIRANNNVGLLDAVTDAWHREFVEYLESRLESKYHEAQCSRIEACKMLLERYGAVSHPTPAQAMEYPVFLVAPDEEGHVNVYQSDRGLMDVDEENKSSTVQDLSYSDMGTVRSLVPSRYSKMSRASTHGGHQNHYDSPQISAQDDFFLDDNDSDKSDEGEEMNDSHNISGRYNATALPSSRASDSLFADIGGSSFENINAHKEFLVSGTPFQNPKENLRIFLSQNHPQKPGTVPEVSEQTRDAIITPSLSQEVLFTFNQLPAFNYLRRLFQPRIPKEGYQWITWNCGCGESMYTDVKELYPGAAQSLQETLRITAAAISEAASNQDNITMPPIVHLPSASDEQSSSDSQTTPGTPLDSHLSNAQTAGTSPENSTDTDEADIVKRYLLMCVNTSKRVHLEQIEVTYAGDDQVLFQGIRQAYYKSQNVGHYVSMPGLLSSLFGEISLWRPKNANFVRVRISPYLRKRITSTNKP